MKPLPTEAKLRIIKRVQNGEKVAKVCREVGISRKTFYKWVLKFKSSKPHLAYVRLADKRFKQIFKFKTLPQDQKLLLVNQVLAGFGTASEICRNFGVSRKTLYKWLKRYSETADDGLEDLRPKGGKHYRAISEQLKNQVISTVAANPEFSVHQLSRVFIGSVGHHGIQNILAREDLNTVAQRVEFAKTYEVTEPVRVAPLYQPEMPLYRWRMLLAPFKTVPKLLLTNPARGFLLLAVSLMPLVIFGLWLRLMVTAPVGISPSGFLFASIALFFGLIFFIYSLKYYISASMVLRLAQSGATAPDSSQFSVHPATSLRAGSSRFMKILSRLGLRLPQRQGPNPLLVNLEKVRLDADNRPFVSIHVAVYNEKKVVERLIRACTSQEWFGGNPSTLRQVFDPEAQTRWAQGSGSTAAKAAFEVVIVDDSTDETTEIAKQTLISADFKLINADSRGSALISSGANSSTLGVSLGADNLRSSAEEGVELFVFSKPGSPTVKLLHRASRAGFKGGALQEALEQTDARAAYIMVVDADFVPYPDTIEQFVKTFQVLAEGQPRISADSAPISAARISADNQRSSAGGVIAAVQGYQWHVLNKSQTWVTRGVRTEYAGSYVIERSGEEIYGGLKQIAGAVYAIRADILRQFGWGTSITEDFELTLRLYEAGYKVAFTPYIQVPAEAVSTIKRLMRQRMRWAEGASFNVKVMLSRMLFGRWETAPSVIARPRSGEAILNKEEIASSPAAPDPRNDENREIATSFDGSTSSPLRIRNDNQGRVWVPSRLTLAEKLEFIYLAPYYLQAAFFVVGTIAWFLSEAVFHTRLPFWTSALGWSLVFTNLLALPLMNIIGLFLEESDERDYVGVLSFIVLSYIVVPFQAYAALKGFLEKQEGPWFRTPKTGAITDVIERMGVFRLRLWPFAGATERAPMAADLRADLRRLAFNPLRADNFRIKPGHLRYVGNWALGVTIGVTVIMSIFAPLIPVSTSYAYASQPVLKTVDNSKQEAGNLKEETRSDEITMSRAVEKTTTGGKKIQFIFHEEPRVRIKLGSREIEFETKEVFGHRANPTKSTIYQDKEAVYEEIIPGIDLRYRLTGDLLVEEFILKGPIKPINVLSVEQTVKTVDVNVVSAEPNIFGFYTREGEEIFKLAEPFMQDDVGIKNYDLSISLEKSFDFSGDYRLTKTLGDKAKDWLADPARVYPVSIDPSVIVSGGIVETDVQFGGLQRKLVYVNSNWYAFYTDLGNPGATGTDVWYKKSSNGTSWGSAVEVDAEASDTDNFNPSVWLESSLIYVAWFDDSKDAIEVNTINTASSDAKGTKCTSADQGTIGSTFTVSIAVADNGTVYFAFTDTSTDTEFGVFKLVFSGCTFTDINSSTVTISADFDGYYQDSAPVICDSTSTKIFFEDDLGGFAARSYIRFPLSSLPTGVTISSVDYTHNVTDGGAAASDLQAYNTNGQANPSADDCATRGTSSADDATPYLNEQNLGSTTGVKTFTLPAEANTDIQNAKSAVGRFSLGLNEGAAIGTNIGIEALENTGTNEPKLVITYTTVTAGDRPVLVTTGNTLHMVYQDGNLSHSVYNGTSWTTRDTTIAAVTNSFYDVTTDNTNIWVLTVSGTTATTLYKFNGSTWSTLTAPWTGQTNVTSVSVTYDSTNSDLYAHVIKDSSEQAYFKSSDATTISWGSETSYAFTAGDLGHISAPMTGAGTGQIGVVLRQGSNFEFAVIPERTIYLLLATPFVWVLFKGVRGRKTGKNRSCKIETSFTRLSSWSLLSSP